MNIVQEWTPSEAELPKDHWSKSAEYLAEKEKAVHPGQGFVLRSNITAADRSSTTHDQMKANFTVEYVKTEEEVLAEVEKIKAEYLDKNEEIFEQLAIDMITNIEKALKEKEQAKDA